MQQGSTDYNIGGKLDLTMSLVHSFWTLWIGFCEPVHDWCLQRSHTPLTRERTAIVGLGAFVIAKKTVSFAEVDSYANFIVSLDQRPTLVVPRTGPDLFCPDSC